MERRELGLRQSHFDTRGSGTHSNEMVTSAAADLNLLCSRKVKQRCHLPPRSSEMSLWTCATCTSCTTSAQHHSWGSAGRGEQELGQNKQCCSSVFRKEAVSWPAARYSLEEKLNTEVQPSRAFCDIAPISFNC